MRSLERGNRPRPPTLVAVALALAGALAHGAALAQEGDSDPAGDATVDSECSPACRAGFACVDGVCRSPCNPPCASGEVCSRGGSCVPTAPAPSQPAPTPGSGWTAPAAQAASGPAFDEAEYAMYKRKRSNGAALMVVGIITILTAGGIGFAAGYTGDETLLWTAIGVEVVGDLLFFPGLAVWIKGKRGMGRLEQRRAASESSAGSGLRLAGIAPLLSPADPRSGRGLALSFAF
jgi:hypothetical protein